MAFDALDSFDWLNPSDAAYGMYRSGWWIADWLGTLPVGSLGGRRLNVHSGGNYARIGRKYSATQGKSFGAHLVVNGMNTGTNFCDFWFFYEPTGGGNNGNSKGQIGFYFAPDGSIKVYRGENLSSITSCVLLGSTAAGVVITGVEFAFETEFLIDNAVGRVKVWVDNTVVLNLTGIDTQHQTAALVNGFCNFGYGSHSWLWDDMWCWDTDTKPVATPMRATQLLPSSDGGTLTLTPSTGTSHFAMVNETTADLMVADWLTGTAPGQLDILPLADILRNPVSIRAVNFLTTAAKMDIAPRAISLGFEHGGVISDGPDFVLSTTQMTLQRIAELNASGAAWTQADINALALRLKVAA